MTDQEPTWMEISDGEVLSIMVDGGKKLCDYAIECWYKDKYEMGREVSMAHVLRWHRIKDRISILRSQFRATLTD